MKRKNKVMKIVILMILTATLFLCSCGKTMEEIMSGTVEAAFTVSVPELTATPEAVPVDGATVLTMPDGSAFSVNEPTGAENEIIVSTIDEFLAAIGSGRSIFLNPGTYALDEAKGYGQANQSPNYEWAEQYDGYGLILHNVDNLTITGHSANDVTIQTTPRYANVLTFHSCGDITVRGVTAGHTQGAGSCSGSVLYFDQSKNAVISDSLLYGCGTRGLEALSCHTITVENCTITDCSIGAFAFERSRDVVVANCNMQNCGSEATPAFSMLFVSKSDFVTIADCNITGNTATSLLESTGSRDANCSCRNQ